MIFPLLRCAILAAAALLAGTFPGVADARPFRGSVPVDVLLCRTSDSGAPPNDANYYNRLFLEGGTGGVADYWRDVSYQNVNGNGSGIFGWYVMTQTTADFSALDRWGRVAACESAASAAPAGAHTVPAGRIRYIVTFPDVDLFGWTGGAFLPSTVDVGSVGHEGGHGLGLDHSFNNDPTYRNAPWAAIGEYGDPWDVMSWANSFAVSTPFGWGPPGPIGHHLDRLGWLPRSRIVTHGADGSLERVYTLAALGHPEAAGALLIRVPFEPGDLFRYYTVEFRRQTRWDAGIPADTILIHDVKRNPDAGGAPQGPQLAWLQLDLANPAKPPAQSLSANGVLITLLSIDPANNQATVRVRSQISDRCLMGFVWREARPSDHVCVTGAERQQTRDENGLAAARREPAGGPYGPDTCKPGFVWREAFAGDHVCVPGASRALAAQRNAEAAGRINPARGVYGPNTCRQGFVWREADDFDWVCVTGQVRQRTRDENALAGARRSPTGGPYGPNTCLPGFVWREAYPGDVVCTPVASRTEAAVDNLAAPSRLAIP